MRSINIDAIMEELESRTLLSAAGSPFLGFGTSGELPGYAVLATRNDGSLIADDAHNQLVVLHPDGRFASNYRGPVPQTIPVQNVQSGGKYLIMNNDGSLTRYNKNGTVDKAFGKNGTVSNFSVTLPFGSPATSDAFYVGAVCVDGTEIFVSGQVNGTGLLTDFVERLTPTGKVDTTFGDRGFASAPEVGPYYPFFMEVGPDRNLYVAGDSGSNPILDRFSESGKFQGEAFQGGHCQGETVAGIAFQHDGKILILTKNLPNAMTLARYNADMTVDNSFGDKGEVSTPVPPGFDSVLDNTPMALSLRADGAVFVSGAIVASGLTGEAGGNYSFAYTTQPVAAAISGRFFDDANGNGKRDPGEAGLPYWAAYVDTNNDGVWEPGEPIAYADDTGYYKFHGLGPGTYVICEARQPAWTQTAPADSYKVTLGLNHLVGWRDFGDRRSAL